MQIQTRMYRSIHMNGGWSLGEKEKKGEQNVTQKRSNHGWLRPSSAYLW